MALTEKKHLYISSFTLNSYRLDEVKEFKDLGVITNEYLPEFSCKKMQNYGIN